MSSDALVTAARAVEGPTAADRARIRAALMAKVAPPTPPTSTPPAPSRPPQSAGSPRWWWRSAWVCWRLAAPRPHVAPPPRRSRRAPRPRRRARRPPRSTLGPTSRRHGPHRRRHPARDVARALHRQRPSRWSCPRPRRPHRGSPRSWSLRQRHCPRPPSHPPRGADARRPRTPTPRCRPTSSCWRRPARFSAQETPGAPSFAWSASPRSTRMPHARPSGRARGSSRVAPRASPGRGRCVSTSRATETLRWLRACVIDARR